MRSRKWTRFSIVSCVVLASAILLAAPARAQGNCVALGGTIVGQFNPAGPDGPGWYGWAYLSFGNDPTVFVAGLVDLNNGVKIGPVGGYEILTFTIEGVGSFQVDAQFTAIAGTTPKFDELSETGKLVPAAGTGEFAGMTGNVSIHGPFAGGFVGGVGQRKIWISQIHGSVCK